MSENKINVSLKKCCICNNSKIGEFTIINGNKYHLCCIEELHQQLKDKDEKISKVKGLLEEDQLSSLSPFELFKIEEEVSEILESE